MTIGRISGPLLKENLLRDEVNLAFETNLLYLDVNTHADDVSTNPGDSSLWTGRIGIRNTNPAYPLDVTGTFRATTILGGELDIDEVLINNNSISSQIGDLVLSAATGSDKVTINSNVLVNGNLHATGSITADGSLTFGDQDTDNVVFAADINSDFLPNVTDTFKLGTPSKRWDQLNVHNINVGDLQIQDNRIEPIVTNNDLVLRANGTGSVVIEDLSVQSNRISSSTDLYLNAGSASQIYLEDNTTVQGTLNVSGLSTFSNVNVSGVFNITGDINGDALQTDNIRITGNNISTTLSNSDLELNTVGSGTILANGRDILNFDSTTWYVSEDSGSDGNDGRHLYSAFATLKYALTQVSAGDTVHLAPGTFTEVFPITVPQGVTIKGSGLRATKIKPTVGTNNKDCFLLNGETTIEDLTIADMFYDSINNTGYAFRFAPSTTITTRSPYVQRVTVLNRGSGASPSDPYGFVSADAGRGAYLDGAQVTRSSIEAAILFNEATFIVPNSRALIMTNGARTEWLTCFTYFADLAIEGVVGATGRGGDGKTYVTFGGVSGSGFQVGETVRLTSTDSSTVINLVVDSVSGNKITVDGSVGTLEGEDFTPASIVGLVSGTTATSVTRYDRSEFAAELRAIAGANIYGNQGVKADGDDVVIQLMAWNFAYIGTGADLTNDKSAVIQANEVIEINNGRVYYNSVDQVGNYRVGDLFTVNFETGAVSFAAPTFDVTSLTGITFTDGTNVTVINPTTVSTGNLVLAGNTLSSTTGSITIDPSGSENLNLNANTVVAGNLDVGGNVTIGGTITVGNADTDSITIVADFTSNLLPNTSNTYDLGSPSKEWRSVYASQFTNDNIVIDDNYIRTTVSNSNLELQASGTGDIELQSDTNVTGNLTVSNNTTVQGDLTVQGDATIVGNTTQQGDFSVTGTLTVTGDIVGGPLRTDDIQIVGNKLETTQSNSDLELDAAGTGTIELLTNTNVTGTFDVSGQTTLASANVEDLTAGRVVLAGTNGELEDSANLTFNGTLLTVTGNQKITGNLEVDGDITLGGNIRIGDQDVDTVTVAADFTSDLLPNTSNTYDLGSAGKQWRTINAAEFDNGTININDNVITTTVSNSNLELRASGTGSILIPNNDVVISNNLEIAGSTELDDVVINGDLTVKGKTLTHDTLTVNGDFASVGNLYIHNTVVSGDIDYITFTVGSAPITAIYLTRYVSVDDIAWFGIQEGPTWTAGLNPALMLLQNHFGPTTPGYSVGDNILAVTNTVLQANTSYTMRIQQTGVNVAEYLFSTDPNYVSTVYGSDYSGTDSAPTVIDFIYNNFNIDGNLTVAKDIITSTVQTDDILIEGNVITTTLSNSDLELRANGTGTIELQENTNVTGTLDVSGQTTLASANIEDLTSGRVVLAGTNGELEDSANLTFNGSLLTVTGNQRITGNLDVDGNIVLGGNIRIGDQDVDTVTVAADFTSDLLPNTSNTYDLGSSTKSWRNVYAGQLEVDGLKLDTTVISTVDSNADIELRPNGTGSVLIDQIRITDNLIEAINSDADLRLSGNSAGVVYLEGTGAVRIPAGSTFQRPATGEFGYIRYNNQTNNIEAWNGVVFTGISGGSSSDANGDTLITYETSGNNEDIIRFFAGIAGSTPGSTLGSNEIMNVSNEGLVVSGTIRIQGNVIENLNSNQDLILRASGTGRVILDGAGGPGDTGNVFATDPLLTLNSAQTIANAYDSGFIVERGSDINTAFIWDESADEFAAISTIEQGTVRGNVAITSYQNISSASIKLNSETVNKVTFTDASKIVRSLDTGRTAYVDGVMKFNTGAQVAIPTGTTVQRPASPQEGSIRYNTTDQVFEGYADASWQGMGIGYGSAPTYQGIIANGVDYEFTLNETPLSSAGIIVALNGVVQEPEFSYRVEDNILMFIDESSTVVTPDLNDRIDVRFLSKPAISTVREKSFTGDGSTTTFAMNFAIRSKPEVLVFVNNIYQDVEVYSVSGKNVIFDQAPQSDDRINIVHIAGIVAPNVATIQEADDSAIAFAIALG